MIKNFLLILVFFILIGLFSLWTPKIILAGGDGVVNAFIVIPSDWRSRVDLATEARYKQNFLSALEEARQFYSRKLNGHAFVYSQNVSMIYATKPIANLNSGEGLPNVLSDLGLGSNIREAPYGHVHVFVVVGSSNRGAGALARETDTRTGTTGGQVYLNHEQIEEWGSSSDKARKTSLGGLIHELGHTFGLTFSGWANAHPCSIISKDQCVNVPGLGTTIAYPPESEYLNSVMGVGLYNLNSPDVGFDNSIYNPEIQKIYKSLFVNPNQDSPPPLVITSPTTIGKISSISPNPVTVGQELQILGSGFGTQIGKVQFRNPNGDFPKFGYELKSWTDSEIKIIIREGPGYRALFDVSVLTTSGLTTYSTQGLVVDPKISNGKITNISPNTVAAGDEITITGSGFGDKTGEIWFTDAVSASPFTQQFGVTGWKDSEIKIVLSDELKKFPAFISVLTTSGEKITAPQSIHPKTSTPSPPKITQVSPNPITVGQEVVISGSGFGQNRSIIIQPIDTNLLRIGNYRINSWTDTEIRISILDGPVTPTPYNFILVYLGKDILSPQVIIQKPSSSVSPTISPSTIQKSTPATSATPTNASAPTQTTSATPSLVSLIKISNYKDFRENPPGDDGSATQMFNSPSSGLIIWKKSTIDPNSPIYIAPMNPDGSNAPILEVSLSNGQQLQVPNSSFTIQAKVIRKIVKIVINGQEVSPSFGQSFPIHLPGTEGIEGTYEVPVIITYNDGSIKALPFKFHYAPVTPAIVPSPESVNPSPQVQTSVPTCGSAYPGGSCSVNEAGQTRKNDCITGSGLAGQSIMECKQVGSIYCWYDAYTDPTNASVKSQFCYESKEASISNLPANIITCSNPTCLRGVPTQRPSDGSWYCYEGNSWVGNAMCLATTPPTLSTCDPQKVTCAIGEIAIRSVNGNWVCANISTGQITNTVPTCSQ